MFRCWMYIKIQNEMQQFIHILQLFVIEKKSFKDPFEFV